MKDTDEIVKRQATRLRFKNRDMDFFFNWLVGAGALVGLSHGELFHLADGIKDGDAGEWRERFRKHAEFLAARGKSGRGASAGQDRLAAAFSYRAALQYTDPGSETYLRVVERMDAEFLEGAGGLGIPLKPIEVPFEGKTLPGYLLEHDDRPRPMLVMVGGGDTFREDLFYLGGYPAWRRGYNALMVDLPGQGVAPARGFTFRPDMGAPISAVLDFMAGHVTCPPAKVALYGASGGGFMTAQAAAADERVGAWVASTPITDLAQLFRTELGAALKTPGWMLRLVLAAAGAVNESAELNLRKYAWQFGTADFKTAVDQLILNARPVDSARIRCPCLFLVGEAEADELRRQASALAGELQARGADVTLRTFVAEEGGEVHCQLNNLRLAHNVVFDWLDRVASPKAPPVDGRLLAW